MRDSKSMSAICVFCGSATGEDAVFDKIARETGRTIAGNASKLVYGGGKVGLMGAVADGCLEAKGEVIGVMPKDLVEREIAHDGLTEFHIVDTMHDRKKKMSELSDGFLVLPGGAGTLEEAFEQWTWAQIGIHTKPIGFLNVCGFFDPLIQMVDRMVEAGFLQPNYRDMLVVESDPCLLLERFATYEAPVRKTYDTPDVQSS